jgi:hypothetical protein
VVVQAWRLEGWQCAAASQHECRQGRQHAAEGDTVAGEASLPQLFTPLLTFGRLQEAVKQRSLAKFLSGPVYAAGRCAVASICRKATSMGCAASIQAV